MSSERWPAIKELLSRALELPPDRREPFLRETAGADVALASEVRELLANEQAASGFLDPPPPDAIGRPLRLISFDFRGGMLGEFEILEEIGSGASGVVHLARQAGLGRLAAVKILAQHLCLSAEHRERFHREALAASKLRHPGIVSVYSFGEQNGAFYIAMEHVKGKSLRAYRETREPGAGVEDFAVHCHEPRVAAAVIEKVARAVQHCHENGVLHRDVKPHNILIDEAGEPRLVDFGLAKDLALEGLTETGALSGTPHYMSPEQARALGRDVDRRTDVYSMGAVLYELLVLQPPFTGTDPAEILEAIRHKEPTPVQVLDPGVPTALAAICAKALAKHPADRYATAREMADDLARFVAGERVHAPHPTLLRKAWRGIVRRKDQVAATLLVLGVTLTIVLKPGAQDVRAEDEDLLRRMDAVVEKHARRAGSGEAGAAVMPEPPGRKAREHLKSLLPDTPIYTDDPAKPRDSPATEKEKKE